MTPAFLNKKLDFSRTGEDISETKTPLLVTLIGHLNRPHQFAFISNLLSANIVSIRPCTFAPQLVNDSGVENNHYCDGEESRDQKPSPGLRFAHPFFGPH